ncbi:MAG: L-aspartate oxidase [Armatimonadetes bacterium]|nr:L-aspartate oxidase [Armatimonadota bacterium]
MIRANLELFDEVIDVPVVVAGSGIAGLCTALGCEKHGVHVLTRRTLWTGGSSFWAQGGMAAAVGDNDSAKLHAIDTVAAGAGLTEPLVAELLTEQAQDAVRLLRELGTRFDLDSAGDFELAKEAAHQQPRVLHANKDATGAELMRALATAVSHTKSITVHEDFLATELALDEAGRVVGLVARNQHRLILFRSHAVVLATGGIGQLYRFTTNPTEARGDGLALAARAGVRLTDLEFVQFHPTALLTPIDPLPLISEALRGEGAVLINDRNERFMSAIHELGELAPRDVVARGVAAEMAKGRRVFLDARQKIGEEFPEHFPNIFERCMSVGIDPRKAPIPVVPAAHYHMGGVDVSLDGQSSLAGLWACGEVSSTGVHGANRLASNSLLEAVVFGNRVAEDIVSKLNGNAYEYDIRLPFSVEKIRDMATAPVGETEIAVMRQTMWDKVGLSRDEAGLSEAITLFGELTDPVKHPNYGVYNRALVCRLIAEAARARRESRGAHYRTDYLVTEEGLRRHSLVQWDDELKSCMVGFEGERVAGVGV